jgi:hypothetical protein
MVDLIFKNNFLFKTMSEFHSEIQIAKDDFRDEEYPTRGSNEISISDNRIIVLDSNGDRLEEFDMYCKTAKPRKGEIMSVLSQVLQNDKAVESGFELCWDSLVREMDYEIREYEPTGEGVTLTFLKFNTNK